MSSASQPVSVLFVCLGNVCRSTMAKGVLRSLTATGPHAAAVKAIDSCGTGAYHVGSAPDARTMDTLRRHGVADYEHTARKASGAASGAASGTR
jgi:low molecular weight phosphotyrosine protein phosphatase